MRHLRRKLNGLKMQLPVEKPLIIIAGPTAVGKTQLSLEIVSAFNGEIISADSRLFYRGLDIGTAKPTGDEQKIVKHHLIDTANPDETLSLSAFQNSVYRVSNELWAKNKVPFLVGGTGQFIRAIMEGWVIPPRQPDKRFRTAIQSWGRDVGADKLHQKLSIIDPQAAKKIEPNNLRRTVRALEVIFFTGERFSSQRRKELRGFNYKVVGLIRNRKELYARIDTRIEKMIENGFVEEVRTLLKKGFLPTLPSLSAIGYKEVIAYLHGEIDLAEVKRLMKKRTRSYVRRQANWFKPDDERIKWFDLRDPVEKEIKDYIYSKEGWQNG